MEKIEIIARGLITGGKKFLVCRDKMNENYFLPGGHIEPGEFSSDALFRELKEELALETKNFYFIGIVENIYSLKGNRHQEINFIYSVEHESFSFQSKEDHIEFSFFSVEEFAKADVRPTKLKEALLKWREDKNFFHVKTIDR